jgi:ankyrin repeat protein
MNGHVAIARLLLAAGACRDTFNTWGMTARDMAVWHGHEAMAAFLGEQANG